MREAVAKRIMEMAQRGVQDREALVADAVRFITANYDKPSKLAKITAHRRPDIRPFDPRGEVGSYCLYDGKQTGIKTRGEIPESVGWAAKPQHRHNCNR
jgi:hypothetical protein